MNLARFVEIAELDKQSELDRACLLAFYHLKKGGVTEFNANHYVQWIDGHNFSRPNKTRLNERFQQSAPHRHEEPTKGTFQLRHTYLKELF